MIFHGISHKSFDTLLVFLNISNISKNIHDDNSFGHCRDSTQRIDKTKQHLFKYLSITFKALYYMFRTKEIRLFPVFVTDTVGNKDL